MEIKDWILLLVPIVLEGIILAFYNKKLEIRFNKITEHQNRKNQIETDFICLIDEAKKYFINMVIELKAEGNVEKKCSDMKLFYDQIYKSYTYCKSNQYVLNKYKTYICSILDQYQIYMDILKLYKPDSEYDKKELDDRRIKVIYSMENALNKIDKIYYSS